MTETRPPNVAAMATWIGRMVLALVGVSAATIATVTVVLVLTIQIVGEQSNDSMIGIVYLLLALGVGLVAYGFWTLVALKRTPRDWRQPVLVGALAPLVLLGGL